MTLARRCCAATIALVLTLSPVALERCRTACASGSPAPHASGGGHACHDVTGDESVTRMDPMARACGHRDDVRTLASASLAAAKSRTMLPLDATQSLPGDVPLPRAAAAGWPHARSVLPRVVLPLDLPLRL